MTKRILRKVVKKRKTGKGNLCGVVYLPRGLVGKRIEIHFQLEDCIPMSRTWKEDLTQ